MCYCNLHAIFYKLIVLKLFTEVDSYLENSNDFIMKVGQKIIRNRHVCFEFHRKLQDFCFHPNYKLIQKSTCINANYFIFNSFEAPTTSFYYVPIICAWLYYSCAARTFYVHGCMWWCLKIICSTQDFHIRRISQSKVMLCITTWAFSST